MPIKKQYLKNKGECKVTFKIPKNVANDYGSASVVGDFNNWTNKQHEMKKLKQDGSFSVSVKLRTGKAYEFRYLFDGTTYGNEPEADRQVLTHFGDSENSVVEV